MLHAKKVLRILFLVMFLLLALAGIGIPPPREIFEKKEDTIELIDDEKSEKD